VDKVKNFRQETIKKLSPSNRIPPQILQPRASFVQIQNKREVELEHIQRQKDKEKVRMA
jgi:hypothetical protein